MLIPESIYILFSVGMVAYYILSLIYGVHRGFLLQLIDTLGLIVALFLAWLFAPVLAGMAMIYPAAWVPMADSLFAPLIHLYLNEIIWFLLIFVAVKLVLLVLKPIIKTFQNIPLLKQVNQLLGGAFGLISSTVWLAVFSMILSLPLFVNGKEVVDATLLRYPSQWISGITASLEGPLQNSEIMEKLIMDFNALTDEDRTAVKEWMKQNNIDEKTMNEIMEKLQK